QRLVRASLADGTKHGAGDTGRSMHVHSHLHETSDHLLDLRLARSLFHYYDHGFCLSISGPGGPHYFSFVSVVSWTSRRSRLRASSMMRSNSLAIASGPSGPSAAMLRTCASTCFSRSG